MNQVFIYYLYYIYFHTNGSWMCEFLSHVIDLSQAEDGEGARRPVESVVRHLIHRKCNSWVLQGKESGDQVNLMLKFATDGAKIGKKFSGVKGVVSIIKPRETIGENGSSPDDEGLVYIYKGMFINMNVKHICYFAVLC